MRTTHSRRFMPATRCVAVMTLVVTTSGADAFNASTRGRRLGLPERAHRERRRSRRARLRGVSVPRAAYAAPPTGKLRRRPLHRPARWRGVRDATQFAPSCPQLPSPPNAPLPGTFTPDQQTLAARMRAAWAGFAAHGDPSTPTLARPQFNQGEQVMSRVPPQPQAWTGFSDAHQCASWAAG